MKLFSTNIKVLGLLYSLAFFSFSLFFVSKYNMLQAKTQDVQDMMYIVLKDGIVIVKMRPDLAPNHVKRIKELVSQGFYNGLVFHRVIDGFMAQTGDPTGTGYNGSGKKLKAEFSSASHKRGVLSMARAMDPDSADSQFFIVLKDSPYLDGQYTVWGEIIAGMEFVDKIKKGDPSNNGLVQNPDKIVSMRLTKDVEEIKN